MVAKGEFHISHDASRLISIFSSRLKKRSRVSREIFNELNFKIELIQGKFQSAFFVNLCCLIDNLKCFLGHFTHFFLSFRTLLNHAVLTRK